jgi:hypothetical protein
MAPCTKCVLNAIRILDQEVQNLRATRDATIHEEAKIRLNDQILSHILSIQHLRQAIADETDENETV